MFSISRGRVQPVIEQYPVPVSRRASTKVQPVVPQAASIQPNTADKIYNIIPIVVCVNYADLLSETLERNRKMFEKYVVITDVDDVETIEVCAMHDVDCKLSDKTRVNGATFNKSGLIHDVQKDLHVRYPDHWMLVMDADIVLPPNFPSLVTTLDRSYLYSMPRKDYFVRDDLLNDRYTIYRHSANYPGYFQLYFRKNILYPDFSKAGDICDVVFSSKFSRKTMLSDVYLTHLGEPNRNVTGRFTQKWS